MKREHKDQCERNEALVAEKIARLNERETKLSSKEIEMSTIQNKKEELGELTIYIYISGIINSFTSCFISISKYCFYILHNMQKSSFL